MPKNTIYVGRPTKWGNPFQVGVEYEILPNVPVKFDSLDILLLFYRMWLTSHHEGIKIGMAAMKELKGKNLACWCKEGELCHADILLDIANYDLNPY